MRNKEEVTQERNEVQAMTLRMPRPDYEALRVVAFATDVSINELVLAAVRNYIADESRRKEVGVLIDNAIAQYQVALDKLADS